MNGELRVVTMPDVPFIILNTGYEEFHAHTTCYAIGDPDTTTIGFPSTELIFNREGNVSKGKLDSGGSPGKFTYFVSSQALLKQVEELKSIKALLKNGRTTSGLFCWKVSLPEKETQLIRQIFQVLQPHFDAIKAPHPTQRIEFCCNNGKPEVLLAAARGEFVPQSGS